MSDTVIKVKDIGKKYVIGHRSSDNYPTLRDKIAGSVGSLVRGLVEPSKAQLSNSTKEDFWALKDINFEVKRGARIGIIGRNGAGKSTLLKILSRITEPTEGEIEIEGRIASLLEVGTGFHPELTGRENIYLNGAILGMSRLEINQKFDEIVDFSEIEKFLDTPVKRYSSGMYVRLAFSVAAHLEPEILIVDEVLAVGDVNFQKKCLGKIENISQDLGRTVLFVSHNQEAIQRLCSECLYLEKGCLVDYGNTHDVLANYLASNSHQALPNQWIDLSMELGLHRIGVGFAKFRAAQYTSCNDLARDYAYSKGALQFTLSIESNLQRVIQSLAVVIYDQHGTKLVNADTITVGRVLHLQKGINSVTFRIEKLYLKSGVYIVGLWLADPLGDIFDFIQSAFCIEVISLEKEQYGAKPNNDGCVACDFDISLNPEIVKVS